MPTEDGHKNLIPLNQRSEEEKRAIAKKGAEACNRKKREKKSMKDLLELAFSGMIRNSATGEEVSRKEATARVLVDKCVRGDLKAIELATTLLGEKKEQMELTGKNGKELIPAKRLSKQEAKALMEEMDNEY